MKVLWILAKIGLCLAICLNLAAADSLELRNGRHLQGKYVGGTTTIIGFMTGRSVEYFSTSDVLLLAFDNGSDPSLGGLQPNPMKQNSSSDASALRQKMSVRMQSPKRSKARLQRVSEARTPISETEIE